MESEQSQNFNERLSQWVASQGFWFQIRYSMTGSGSKGTAMFHLLRLGFRLMIFLLVVAAGAWIYLVKVTESEKFSKSLESSIKSGLFASDAEMEGFSRTQGQLVISRFACQGGNDTFFTSLEARNIRCKMGLLDGTTGQWDTGVVAITTLDMELRAGADDEESAAMLSSALFDRSQDVLINTVEVARASLRWGYSDRTRGNIENSALRVQRHADGMTLNFKGGNFSQNWLRNLEIVNLVVVCDREGLRFETAEFRRGQGSVSLTGLKVVGGERPMVSGTAKIRKLGLEDAVPSALRSFIEGSISGNFAISGSTNTSDGIGFAGQVILDGQDTISLRDRVPLLKTLSILDYVRNYHRVDFREGSFRMKTTGGGMELTDLSLKADDLFTMEGKMRVRLPTPEEAKAGSEPSKQDGNFPIFNGQDLEEEETRAKPEEADFTLRKAGAAFKREKEKEAKTDGTESLSDRLMLTLQTRQLEAQASERASRTLRYEGQFRVTIPADAFERAPRLHAQFPLEARTGRIPLMVPIEGMLHEITLKQAEDLYQQGQH